MLRKRENRCQKMVPILVICYFAVFFPFLMPVAKALEIDFFPKDAQQFFKTVAQQAIEARKESEQVQIANTLSTDTKMT